MALKSVLSFIKDLTEFLKNVSEDPRIPARDKVVLVSMIALIISPFDFIPDWIPVIGLLDDFVILSLVLDYFFERLDSQIILSHYPWGMKSFVRIRRLSRTITWLTPSFLKDRIWKFQKDPYK